MLFRPSTEFHDADMGVDSAAKAASGVMVMGGTSNVGATNGVNDIFLICSMAARRVEGAENPWPLDINVNATQHRSSSSRRLARDGAIMVMALVPVARQSWSIRVNQW